MKINFLGDSITAGATLASVDEMYTNILCKKVGAIENNYGVCGTRIARQTKPSAEAKFDEDFLKRAEKLDTTADFTFVFGGTNDYGHGDASLGEIGDKTPYSFYGALNLLTEYLLTKFNNRKFCYVLPLPRYNENSPYGETGARSRAIRFRRTDRRLKRLRKSTTWESSICPTHFRRRLKIRATNLQPTDCTRTKTGIR